MKIAVVFNEFYPEINDQYQTNLGGFFQSPENSELEIFDPIAEFQSIAESLHRSGYDAYILNLLDDINIFFDDFEKNQPDLIFNLVEIFNSDAKLEMSFAGILELMKIPFTGSSSLALGTCQNKFLTKQILSTFGLSTPKFRLIKEPTVTYKTDLTFPIIVKPAYEDASVGIENESVVKNYNELKNRVEHIFSNFNQHVLLEEYVSGRELNVAVIGDHNHEVLPISEIDFSAMPDHLHNIVSYQAKWEPEHEAFQTTTPKCPADLPSDIQKKAEEIAIIAAKGVNARDYCRVDMRLSADNKLYILEVNPNPDLSLDAGFMRSAQVGGYKSDEVIKKIVELALNRKGQISV